MNRIQKSKTALLVLAIIAFLLGIGGIVGGVILLINGCQNPDTTGKILQIVFGIILGVIGIVVMVYGLITIFVGSAVKATKGSIGETNEIAKNSINTKKCPKCGATNTIDCNVCQVCGEEIN